LYVPASRREFLAKIPALPADLILVDLEDGVAAGLKNEARDNIRGAVASGALSGERPWMLRVNGGPLGPPHEDLMLVGFAKPAIVVVPKAEEPELVRVMASRFADHGAGTAIMIETACGVARVMELLGAHAAVCMAIVGSEDLRLSLRARPDPDRAWERHALSHVLLAVRRHGRVAIDSVYPRYRDRRGVPLNTVTGR
jgi:citrate lyase beta subunit